MCSQLVGELLPSPLRIASNQCTIELWHEETDLVGPLMAIAPHARSSLVEDTLTASSETLNLAFEQKQSSGIVL